MLRSHIAQKYNLGDGKAFVEETRKLMDGTDLEFRIKLFWPKVCFQFGGINQLLFVPWFFESLNNRGVSFLQELYAALLVKSQQSDEFQDILHAIDNSPYRHLYTDINC